MNDHAQPPEAKITARRKLIRGAFSVPAALAVHNGSALAATSNNKACAIKSIAAGGTPPAAVMGATHDNRWTRVAAYPDQTPGTPKYWIQVSDLSTLATAKNLGFSPPSGTGSYIEAKTDGTYNYVRGTPTTTLSATPAGWLAVLFDNGGVAPQTVRVVGFVKYNASAFAGATGAVTGSCWTSLRA